MAYVDVFGRRPIPGLDAVDNGDGTATTYYDDGSAVTWDITSGEAVFSTPGAVPAARPPAGAVVDPTGAAGPLGAPWSIPWGQPGSVAQGPRAAAAGTTGTPYGSGWIGDRGMVPIRPEYLDFLRNPPREYIPGSGMWLGWDLSQPGLLNPQGLLTTYGSGMEGDPSGEAAAPRTPQEWVQGPRLFEWDQNMPPELGYIPNLFGRSEPTNPSGLSTSAWEAPEAYWQGLYQQIAAGRVRPTARGWQFLSSVRGQTPQGIGGAAPQLAQQAGAGAGGPGPGGPPAGAGAWGEYINLEARRIANEAAQVAAQRAYWEALVAGQSDELAFRTAQDEALRAYRTAELDFRRTATERNLAETQRQFDQRLGFEREAQQQNAAIQAGGIAAQLRGPRNAFQQMQFLYGLNQAGQPRLFDALQGLYAPAAFQAPQMPAQPAGLETLGADLAGARDPQALLSALPAPNKLNAPNFLQLNRDAQDFTLSAYEAAGVSGNDVLDAVQRGLPQFRAPLAGTVMAGGGYDRPARRRR